MLKNTFEFGHDPRTPNLNHHPPLNFEPSPNSHLKKLTLPLGKVSLITLINLVEFSTECGGGGSTHYTKIINFKQKKAFQTTPKGLTPENNQYLFANCNPPSPMDLAAKLVEPLYASMNYSMFKKILYNKNMFQSIQNLTIQ